MATPEQIQRAMRDARAAGDLEAVADLRAQLTEAYQGETRNSAVEGMGTGQRLLAGIGQGASNIGRNIGNVLGMEGYSDEDLKAAQEQDRALLGTGAGRVGSFLGETLATAPVGGLAGGAARAGLAATRAARLAPVIAGAAAGATEGGLSAGPGNRLSGATVGGTVGAVAPWALTRLGNPIKATPEAQFLMDKGVDLTPGQMNPSSLLGSVEEIGSKLPFIENARRRAQQQAVKATIRETGAPGSTVAKAKLENLPDAERLMQDVIDSYAPAYGTFENSQFYPRNAGGALADAPGVEGAFTRAAKTTDIAADQASRDAADAYMRNQLTRLPHADPMKELSFKELQELRTKLRAEARRLAGTATGGDRSELIRRGADEVSDVFGSQMNPLDKQALDAIDANYRQAMIVDDAMQRAAGREGGFTFSQGMGALRKPEGKAFGRGGTGEPVSDLIRAGKRVFDERTPATGLRTLFPLALAGLGFAKPAAIAALPLATLAATKGGRKFMGGGYAGQEKLVRALEAIRRKSPGMFDALVGSAASGSVVGD